MLEIFEVKDGFLVVDEDKMKVYRVYFGISSISVDVENIETIARTRKLSGDKAIEFITIETDKDYYTFKPEQDLRMLQGTEKVVDALFKLWQGVKGLLEVESNE